MFAILMSSLHYAPLLFYCFKAMFQIVNNIIDMLGTDGKTDGGRLDTACQQAFLIQLGMGGWMPDGSPETSHQPHLRAGRTAPDSP